LSTSGSGLSIVPSDGPILVVCRSGARSNAAAAFLDSKGFSNVYDMLGGMGAWTWETAPCKYSGGSGTADDPYQIATAEDLIALGETPENYDKHFILTADIDLDPNLPGRKMFDRAVIAPDVGGGDKWAFQGSPFTGIFEGGGHTISHLTVRGESYLGLFGRTSAAVISYVGLEAVNVNGTGDNIGGLVGRNGGGITMSYSDGMVNGRENVGGLVGFNESSIIASCSAGVVNGEHRVGGLVGDNWVSIVVSCSTATVVGNAIVGGLAGGGGRGGTVTTSYSVGAVTGNVSVGGLVGRSTGAITTSFWDVEASGQNSSAGGTGLTTAEMQEADTFLSAGWDFVGEVVNGTSDYWQMAPGDYPRLCYCGGNGPEMPEGLGTVARPYLIDDARGLGVVCFEPTAHYRLETSLDLSGITWSMAVVPWFSGTFDGNGHTILHLNIRGGEHLGFFGHVARGARVLDLGIENVDIVASGDYVGGLVGVNWGDVSECSTSGTISSTSRYVGGLVGSNSWDAYVVRSSSSVAVSGENCVGGLVGWNAVCTLGGTRIEGVVLECRVATAVTGDVFVGGLVGLNQGFVTASYAHGTVSGEECAGGLVGANNGDMSSCYSTCAVDGTRNVGGLVGSNAGGAYSSFWDTQTSGQPSSAGGTGPTTSEMQNVNTYLAAGWDFVCEAVNGVEDIWWMPEGGYPRLVWEVAEVPPCAGVVVELDEASFDETIAQGVVLVDFYATWCSHCRTQAPILDDVAAQVGGKAVVGKLDIDEARSVAQAYGVSAIPTLIVFKNGNVRERFVGVTQAPVLVAAIQAAIDHEEVSPR